MNCSKYGVFKPLVRGCDPKKDFDLLDYLIIAAFIVLFLIVFLFVIHMLFAVFKERKNKRHYLNV